MVENSNNTNLDLQAVYDVPLQVSVVIGNTELRVSDILKFTSGTVIELDKKVGEPVDVYINGKVVAKGEIVLVNDKVGVTLTEMVNGKV
ncbi:Flagellar motor switch protein FliN [Alphaproteobacteria bacterium]